ncbi:MAG: DUF5320 domain-containing protein [bacterium]
MPRGDGTGPAGEGPMTGRATGYCSGNNQPGFMNTGRNFNNRSLPQNRNISNSPHIYNRVSGRRTGGAGRGLGRGFRGGRGRGRRR